MAERIFKAEVPDGHHLGRVKGTDGEYRGLLFDKDNNLVGHLGLTEVDEAEGADPDDWDDAPSERPGSDDVDLETIVRGLEAIVQLAVILAAATEAASPHVKRWWNERGRLALRSARIKAEASWNKLKRRSKNDADATPEVLVTESDGARVEASTELLESYQDLRETMSSAEARQRFVSALVAQEFADAQMRMVRNARIEDPEERSPKLKGGMQAVTSDQVREVIGELLDRNPELIEQENLAQLAGMLGSPDRALPATLRDPDIETALRLTSGTAPRQGPPAIPG